MKDLKDKKWKINFDPPCVSMVTRVWAHSICGSRQPPSIRNDRSVCMAFQWQTAGMHNSKFIPNFTIINYYHLRAHFLSADMQLCSPKKEEIVGSHTAACVHLRYTDERQLYRSGEREIKDIINVILVRYYVVFDRERNILLIVCRTRQTPHALQLH